MEEESTKIITPEFYALLKQYTNSNDPLEDPNFDPVSYLNEKFPDFKSLEKLPFMIEDFEKQLSELDEEIDNLMYEKAIYNDQMKQYMTELDNDVEKIIELISRIKTNSDINETTVKMICNDIKNLDNARNNITTTISSLTKLIILITGIEKLEFFVKSKSFKEAANAIAASNDILEYFKEYKHVTQVSQLYTKKDHLCTVLLGSILDEFRNNLGLVPSNSEQLYEGCLAINAVGDSAIKSLKTLFTQQKLVPYEEIFDPKAKEAVPFEDTERRFEWLKRTLKEYNEKYDSIFPPSWGMKSQLCQEFCRITKLHLNEILMMNLDDGGSSSMGQGNSQLKKKIDVDVLVRVLNNTINFENNLHTYLVNDFNQFNSQNKSNEMSNYSNQLSLSGIKTEKPEFDSQNNIEEIKLKYEGSAQSENKLTRSDPNTTPKYSPFRVKGVISESFEPYMVSYVAIEEKKLKNQIDELKNNDRIEGKLLVSSLHLFNNIKQAMNRCLTFSKSKTFYDLARKFKDVFEYYNDKILLHPKIRSNMNLEKEKMKLSEEDIKLVCYIINTSDYCITTVNALIDSLKEKIEEKYRSQICYDDVIDCFKLTYKNAFEIIMQNVKNLLNENFSSIVKLTWTNLGMSNDVSSFVIYSLISNNNTKENDFNFICLSQIMKKEFSKAESRLKCLGSVVMEMGNAYKTFVEDKSKEDFDKLLQIRGVRKSDIADYEKIFI
jgi:predicted transcriptional regulator